MLTFEDPDAEAAYLLGDGPAPETDTVTAAELGEWLNLSPARLHALAREGVIPRQAGRFELRPAIRAYVEHIRAGQKGRLTSNPDLAAQKLRIAEEQADKLAIANAKTRGELLDSKAVAASWARVLVDVRAAMLAIPQRVAGRCALDRTTAGTLDEEIRAALEALADEN